MITGKTGEQNRVSNASGNIAKKLAFPRYKRYTFPSTFPTETFIQSG
jgi:hypothetical protein